MTCREKLKLDHPEWSESQFLGAISGGCPSDYGYLEDPPYDDEFESCIIHCKDCWNRKIPEEGQEVKGNVYNTSTEYPCMSCNTGWSRLSSKGRGTCREDCERLAKYYERIADAANKQTPVIKDSGNRREFESGAVRDMQEGKGRCDLMPLEVVANIYKRYDGETPPQYYILMNIKEFLSTNETRCLYEALHLFASKYKGYSTMFLEVAKHFEDGAKKYGENNWQKGIPPKCYIDSAVRHYLKWLRGDKDEPHDRAFVWNLMCCIWEVDYHKPAVDEENE